jgi:hypothetical protein
MLWVNGLDQRRKVTHDGPRKDISILPLLQVPDIAKQRGIAILKRPDDIRGSGAEYCMFAFDDWHSKLLVIGNAIKAFLEEGHGCLYGNGQQLQRPIEGHWLVGRVSLCSCRNAQSNGEDTFREHNYHLGRQSCCVSRT